MKKWLFGIVLAVISAVAFALPSPHQIEDALAAQQYSDARGMVQQVLNERPDSARAHLLNAFILEHVDHNLGAANQELSNAANLDKRGDVKNSSLFGRVVAEIDGQAAKQTRTPPVQQQVVQYAPNPVVASPAPYVAPEPKHSGHGFLIFLLIVVVFGVLVYFFIRGATRRQREVETVYTPPYRESNTTRRVSSGYSAPRVTYVEPAPVIHQPVIVQQAPQQGLGFGGQVAATATGVVAGELIHDSLISGRGRSSWDRDDSYERDRRRDRDSSSSWDSGSSYVAPTPAPEPVRSSPVSYSNERSSFSSGSDDSWSSRSSSSDSSSSYSSSSSDSSSSWSSDSSSSYDSGSSSGGSDW